MSIVNRDIRICDLCGKPIENYGIRTKAVITNGYFTFQVIDFDYCNLDCLFKSIKNAIDNVITP